jgi:hypothetical protein
VGPRSAPWFLPTQPFIASLLLPRSSRHRLKLRGLTNDILAIREEVRPLASKLKSGESHARHGARARRSARPRAARPLRGLFRGARVNQRQVQGAARAAAHPTAAGRSEDPGDSASTATSWRQHNIELGRVARRCAFLAVEGRIHRTIANERKAVIGCSAQPGLHCRGDVDEDVLVLVRACERDAGAACRPERRRVARVNRILGPGPVHVIHIEATRGRDRIHVKLQRCLGDVGARVAGRDRRQIELNAGSLRTLNIEQRLGTIVRCRIGGVRVGIRARSKLTISAA